MILTYLVTFFLQDSSIVVVVPPVIVTPPVIVPVGVPAAPRPPGITYSPIRIKNMALAELPADPIASENEASLQARETGRWYPIVVAELLSMHAWSWGKQRAALAEVYNDRAGEWGHAYALPSGSVYPLRIVPNINGVPVGYQALTGQLVATPYVGWGGNDPHAPAFVIAGSTLYTQVPQATLEFTTDVGMEPYFTPMFARAVALELAVRICPAITKSREKQGDLIKLAETQRQRAIASDLNQQPQRHSMFSDEAGIARGIDATAVWPWGSTVTYQNGG